MLSLLETLRGTKIYPQGGFVSLVKHALLTGVWDPLVSFDYYKHFNFKDISKVGDAVIGVCSWSILGSGSPSERVVYMGYRQDVKTPGGTLISPIIIKEMWEVNCNNDSDLWETHTRLTRLPKQKWWHRREYQASEKRYRLEDKYTLESALLAARIRAENIFGITSEIEVRLQQVIQDLKYRDRALEELNVQTASV